MARFVGAAEPLSKPGFEAAVAALGAGMAELVAVPKVESRSCELLPNRRPKILYERHALHCLTGGAHSAAHPDISNPPAGGYAGNEREYPRLERAMRLDRTGALVVGVVGRRAGDGREPQDGGLRRCRDHGRGDAGLGRRVVDVGGELHQDAAPGRRPAAARLGAFRTWLQRPGLREEQVRPDVARPVRGRAHRQLLAPT